MRIALTVFLLLFSQFIPNCRSASNYNIQEVALSGGGVQYNGSGHSSSVTYRRDGTAESVSKTFEHDYPPRGEVIKKETAKISPEQFEQFAKAINESGIFSEEEGHILTDSNESIHIVYAGGEKTIRTLNRQEPGITAAKEAMYALSRQLDWKAVE